MITTFDFTHSLPLIIVTAASLLIMIAESIFPKKGKAEDITFYICLLSLVAAIVLSAFDIGRNIQIYNNFLRISTLSALLNIALISGILITVISSKNYLESEGVHVSEYYLLMMFSLIGMMLMVNANDLLILFVGLELMSVCFYVLAGFIRKRLDSNESAIKYFLLGAFLTGFLLLGIAFIFGASGSTNYFEIANKQLSKEPFYMIGITLVFIAFIFKTGSFPLQMWIPDVYQGAPTIVTGMMSSVGKTAAFGALISFFMYFDVRSIPLIIAIVAILTMLYGNVVALVQSNIKRLLAYSSIAHAGYIMIGFIIINIYSTHAIVFYLISYILMQLGAFVTVGIVENKLRNHESRNDLESYKGLGKTNPLAASFLSIFLFSLAGIPPFAGFWGKYYIFLSAIQNNYIWVAIVGILLSLVGVYYYIKVILYMWFYEPAFAEVEKVSSHFSFTAALISVLGLFAFGIYPELILKFIRIIS